MLPGEREIAGLTCSEVLADLSAYLDRELTPERAGRIEAHVSQCQACATFGATFGRMLDEVRARMAAPDALPVEVEARLTAALRSRLE